MGRRGALLIPLNKYDKKLHAGIEWMDDTVKLRLLPCENPVVDRLAFDVDRLTLESTLFLASKFGVRLG